MSLTLEGGASSDGDGHALSYRWESAGTVLGSGVVLSLSWEQLVARGIVDGTTSRSIQLYVEDGFGGFNLAASSLTIQNTAPTAQFTGPTTVLEGVSVTFSFGSPTDPSPGDTAAGFLYSIDLNSDGDFTDPGEILDSTNTSLSVTFPDDGTYQIRGRIKDRDGGETLYPQHPLTVAVQNVVPTATLALSTNTFDQGSTLAFGLINPVDVPADLAKLRYSFDLDGDGLFEIANVAESSQPVRPLANGNYLMRVRLDDTNGGIADYSQLLRINNVAPKVESFTASTNSTLQGDVVSFAGTFSDPGEAFDQAKWKGRIELVAGGSVIAVFPLKLDPSTKSFSATENAFSMAERGSFTARAIITDGEPGTPIALQLPLTVANRAPVVDALSVPTAVAGRTWSSTFTFSDPGADSWTYSVDFGDGSSLLNQPVIDGNR